METELQEELEYLKRTLDLLVNQLKPELEALASKREELTASWRDMWENTVPFASDFERLTEISQFLAGVSAEALNVESTEKRIKKYKRLLDSPYFGRFDFAEEGTGVPEKIYLGRHTVMDKETHDVYVYDWRSPIAGIYYRYELGEVEYQAPVGIIRGKVSLKRQYKIKNSRLEYYFDCSVHITDGILHEILGRNASPQMRAIVETIQKEQDLIIRDNTNDALIVQGVAGSGKTSVALHRIAYLLYEGRHSGLKSNNVLIISPNDVFNDYISNVLPELGEENVAQTTIDDLYTALLGGRFPLETRAEHLERLINRPDPLVQAMVSFKSSKSFLEILKRFLVHYAHHCIPFADVYYNGKLVIPASELRRRFLNNPAGLPMAKQLERLEKSIWETVRPLQKERRRQLEEMVAEMEGHELEIKPYSRLLAIKEAAELRARLEEFTKVDYFTMYKRLFQDRELFFSLAEGLALPDNIDAILEATAKTLAGLEQRSSSDQPSSFKRRSLPFEDCAPLLFLKVGVEGCHNYAEIRHVVIDEAQDYNPLQYEVFNLLFGHANYTVLGDVNQTIAYRQPAAFYDEVAAILKKPQTAKLFLNRGFRSTYEISRFAQKLLGIEQESPLLERHGSDVRVVQKATARDVDQAVAEDISHFLNRGFETIAIICKTMAEAKGVHSRLREQHLPAPVQLIGPEGSRLAKGVVVIPSYIAKGLEFDVVIVYDAGAYTYSTEFDRRLLYIVCTRALHELVVYTTGSPWFNKVYKAPHTIKNTD